MSTPDSTCSFLWAKQGGISAPYPLLAHLLDTAFTAQELFDHWLRPGLQRILAKALCTDLTDNEADASVIDIARKRIGLIAGLHDVGKASPAFQRQSRQNGPEWDVIREQIIQHQPAAFTGFLKSPKLQQSEDLRRHERMSALAVTSFLPKKMGKSADAADDHWLELILLGHHGRFTIPFEQLSLSAGRMRTNITSALEQDGWLEDQHHLIRSLESSVGGSLKELSDLHLASTPTLLLSGLTILADRIASGTEWVEQSEALMRDRQLTLADGAGWIALRRQAALERIEHTVGIYHSWPNPEEAQRSILGSYQANAVQQAARQSKSGLWTVMVPTGTGKTEAALLRHSLASERLIFLLPTQATTNALMQRVQKAFQGTPNVASLAHSMASIEDFYRQDVTAFSDNNSSEAGGLFPTSFVRSGSSRLLAPVCVGTIDQALMASLQGKWVHLRLLALANAHVVIDEAHTLDRYQSKLLELLLQWLGSVGARVTVLTATLPTWQRNMIRESYSRPVNEEPAEITFPSVELTALNGATVTTSVKGASYTVDVELESNNAADLVDQHCAWAVQMRKRYPLASIAVLCNQVKRAQDVAEQLSQHGQVILLHSRMTAAHRQQNAQMLNEVLGPNGSHQPVFVVGTQTLEASLDFDADLMRTELCPSASLIQRLGRLWRRNDTSRQTRVLDLKRKLVSVVRTSSGDSFASQGLQYPYFVAELLRTWNWLSSHEQLRIPEHCQNFVDTSQLRLEDLNEGNDADYEQFSADGIKAMRGDTATKTVSGMLGKYPRMIEFQAATAQLNEEENQFRTRLIEQQSTRLILISQSDSVPGAWKGSADQLVAISSTDRDGLRQALAGSVTVPENFVEAIKKDSPLISLASSRTVLSGFLALPHAERWYSRGSGFLDPAIDSSSQGPL